LLRRERSSSSQDRIVQPAGDWLNDSRVPFEER
jgi:hypothetical protein